MDRYHNMTEEDKIKRREAKDNRYRNMSEEQKVKKRNMKITDIVICLKNKRIKK